MSDKYENIIQAAMEVIEEIGFDKASVAQVVKRAGVAQGTFYLYFSSKNELVPAIAERILSEQLERVKEKCGKKPKRKKLLQNVIDATFEITEEYKQLISFCYAGISLYYSFERWEKMYKPYYEWLEAEFKRLQKEKEITKDIDLAYAVNYTVGLIEHGAEAHYLSHSITSDEKEAKKQLYQYVKNALYN